VFDNGFVYRVVDDRGTSFGVQLSDGSVAVFACHRPERPAVGDRVLVDETLRRVIDVVPRRSWIARCLVALRSGRVDPVIVLNKCDRAAGRCVSCAKGRPA
jgi:hypothetical protein